MEQRRPRLADVARVAGVSMAAASRAMNGGYGVSDEVRHRVRDVATRLGFAPHNAARALATGRASAGPRERIEILIVDPDPRALSAKPFYGRVLTGAMSALTGQDVALEVRLVPAPPAADPDPPFGRLLISMPAVPGAAYAARGHGRAVALGETARGVPVVSPDNADGGRQAATHLVTSGRRRVGAVFGPPTPCSQERKAGSLRLMAAAGLSVTAADGDFTRPTAYAAARELLAREPALDAVFAACDVSAMGVLQALREAGRRVPEDVRRRRFRRQHPGRGRRSVVGLHARRGAGRRRDLPPARPRPCPRPAASPPPSPSAAPADPAGRQTA